MARRLLAGAWIATAAIGCDKPTAGECRKAINNIRVVLGTSEQSEFANATAGWVRSCRGSAKKKAVNCAIQARTVDQLTSCGLVSAEDIAAIRDEERKLKAVTPKAPPTTGAGSGSGGG